MSKVLLIFGSNSATREKYLYESVKINSPDTLVIKKDADKKSIGIDKVRELLKADKLKGDKKRIANKVRMKGMVKGQIDSKNPLNLIPTQGSRVDWYQDLGEMDWMEVKTKYLEQVGR